MMDEVKNLRNKLNSGLHFSFYSTFLIFSHVDGHKMGGSYFSMQPQLALMIEIGIIDT